MSSRPVWHHCTACWDIPEQQLGQGLECTNLTAPEHSGAHQSLLDHMQSGRCNLHTHHYQHPERRGESCQESTRCHRYRSHDEPGQLCYVSRPDSGHSQMHTGTACDKPDPHSEVTAAYMTSQNSAMPMLLSAILSHNAAMHWSNACHCSIEYLLTQLLVLC